MSDIQERTDTKEKKKSWSVGSLFWGLLLVLIGGLALASNFGWADVHWVNVWMLWPLVIVAIGLSVLSIRNLAWKITTLIFAVLTVAFIAYVALGDFSSPVTLRTYEISKEVENNDIKSVQVKVVAGTGTINITSADQSEVVRRN